MFSKLKNILIIGILVLLFSACDQAEELDFVVDEPNPIGLGNPSALYCENLGYENEIVTNADGSQDGNCVFPDGSSCGSWDFLSGRCRPEMSFCEQQGNTLQEAPNIGDCFFPDGSFCLELDYFNGECSPGDNIAIEEPIGDNGS